MVGVSDHSDTVGDREYGQYNSVRALYIKNRFLRKRPAGELEGSRRSLRLLLPFNRLNGFALPMRRSFFDDVGGEIGVRAHVVNDASSSSPSGLFRFLSFELEVGVP